MELYSGEFIQSILNQIQKQNNNEKYLAIYPFIKYHNILLTSQIIQFDESCCCCFATPLDKIFGAVVIDAVLYILFRNDTLHVLYKDGVHNVLRLESDPSEWERREMKTNHEPKIYLN